MIGEALLAAMMQLASLFVIACCIFLISSLIAAGTFFVHRNYVKTINQRLKSQYLIFHALCAVSASIVVTIWLSLPRSPRLPFVFEHCHSSNCATHIPAVIDPTLFNLLFAFFAIGMVTLCFILIKGHQKKLEQRINSLLLLSNSQGAENNYSSQATIINVPQPILLNVGLLSPKLILSSVITKSLEIDDVKILLAYEYAKAKQFENLKVKLVQIACLFWPARTRRLAISDLQAALRSRALEEIRQLFGSQQPTIPNIVLNKMTQDLREFVAKIENDKAHLSQPADLMSKNTNLITPAPLASIAYFMGLVVVTSNLTHFVFELIG
ncbi:hypothetical protein [uncultured Paraglaciecola sp.]|uniref:hypothetical protein n=1 Tax=uncultured Paraglaciecola sp. TaxID=1765024 RepID=UPI00260DD02B|nr:hypothetical protein [uncultured Paraglaciecola sp.]